LPFPDRLLATLDADDVIVLSEHVDYWNHIGWNYPFSSAVFSNRQRAYASHFGIPSVYTPQMVVDGKEEFVGSEAQHAKSSILQASRRAKIGLPSDFAAGRQGPYRDRWRR
jgi:hypothetical protein